MKHFAQFYSLSTGYVEGTIPPVFRDDAKQPIPACGDRAVVQLDGRYAEWRRAEVAHAECKQRGFIGYRMMRGESLARMHNNGPLVRVAGH